MEVQIVSSLSKVEADEWNRLRAEVFPFSRYEHLLALETTGCLGRTTGWFPHYVLCREKPVGLPAQGAGSGKTGGRLVAATWLYQKTNSYGEFVFDHEWADLYARMGQPYFPKAVGAIPFTPATGSKLLGSSESHGHLVGLLAMLAERQGNSSAHELFIPSHQRGVFEAEGFAIRTGVQFHWQNRNYSNFDDYLLQLKKKRRKEISYERRMLDPDLEIRCLEGSDLTPEAADFAYDLYQKTNLEKISVVCLTRAYFQEIFSILKPYLRFFVARSRSASRSVAGALYFCEGDRMFGRYWGCLEDYRFLHFELCYYAPIEWAIVNKIRLLEAGAQGSHKISRGFLPTLTFSAHRFWDQRVQDIFVQFCEHERKSIDEELARFEEHFPYREGNAVGLAGDPA